MNRETLVNVHHVEVRGLKHLGADPLASFSRAAPYPLSIIRYPAASYSALRVLRPNRAAAIVLFAGYVLCRP